MRCEWRVGEPANVGRGSGAVESIAADEAEVQNDAAQRTHPEAEGVQPGKGHIPRADHQRHKIVGESKQQRHADQENHSRAVHGEELIEQLRRNEVVVRDDELDADRRQLPGRR